jgi:glycosyltransferase involved in cell wall biosynthesis
MQKPIKIAFDASPLLVNKTGVAYYTERLVIQMARMYPNDIELIGFYYNFLGRRSTDHFPQAPNIRYKPNRFTPSKIVYQLRRWGIEIPLEVLSKEKADFALFPNFLGYPSLFKTPAAPVVHDLTYIDLPQYVAAKNGSDLRKFVPKQINRSSFVITVSDFSKAGLIRQYDLAEEKIVVTHIPPEKPRLHDSQTCKAKLTELGITKPYILFLGTVEPRKNIPNLIDAYAALPETTRSSHTLVIVGRIGWNCEKEIARLAAAKTEGLDVVHVGYVDDETKAVLFQSAKLFAHASEYEGFGMPVLEAMSYKTACIVSDIPVFREVAGNAAQYFDQANITDMSQKIHNLLENPDMISRLQQTGLERAQSYKWEAVAQKLYQAIRSAI